MDDDSCLEDLIFKHSLEENDVIMENHSLDPLDFDLKENFEEHLVNLNDYMIKGKDSCLDDPFDFGLKEAFVENKHIFEDIPKITLDTPSLEIDLLSSQFHTLHEPSLQIPLLEPWVVDCEPSFSVTNQTDHSYFLTVADEPIFIFFEPALFQLF